MEPGRKGAHAAGPATARPQLSHSRRAVVAHAGEHDAEKVLRGDMLQRARDQAFNARVPGVLRRGGIRNGGENATAQTDLKVGIATTDIGHATAQRHRPGHLDHFDF